MEFLWKVYIQVIAKSSVITLGSGITALAKCIESNPNLKKLNINDNTVTERGALAIGEALENCKNLETLDMGDCLIRNKGKAIENVS